MKDGAGAFLLCGIFFLLIDFGFQGFAQNSSIYPQEHSRSRIPKNVAIAMTNKKIPNVIRSQVLKALSFYPELRDQPIEFKFKKNIKKSTMQAQPKFSGIFKKKEKRAYVILISLQFQIEDDSFNILDVEDQIMVGWLGHELGHIMDYKNRSALGMLWLGAKYLLSTNYIQQVERQADTYAVMHGMGDYILATKNFILHRSEITEKYRDRIKRLYLSPEEILAMVNNLEKDEIEEKVDQHMEKQN